MTYTKPQFVISGDALRVTKGQAKNSQIHADFGGTVDTTPWNTMTAYESDE